MILKFLPLKILRTALTKSGEEKVKIISKNYLVLEDIDHVQVSNTFTFVMELQLDVRRQTVEENFSFN
ncbi:CLUMA_CG006897, isoform A [Clunio marinus]|uniref:CLUMA_CG006897, isoform A n=1 Tax=Clunio marinus TaxID=568069 RepID=A0A1J1I190_9DIPT|nr:CLUMA_CG006897, isoform A [Clunio marinus]